MYSKHVIIGNLGADPEQRVFPNAQPVCNFSVAVNRQILGKDGERTNDTTWYRVQVFGKLAEQCGASLHKGSLVLVEGDTLKLSLYTDRDGKPSGSMQLTAKRVEFLSKRHDPARVADADDAEVEYDF
jgi:single-strand DNA-binding protein